MTESRWRVCALANLCGVIVFSGTSPVIEHPRTSLMGLNLPLIGEGVPLRDSRRLQWVNHRRLLEPIGNVPPAESETAYYRQLDGSALAG